MPPRFRTAVPFLAAALCAGCAGTPPSGKVAEPAAETKPPAAALKSGYGLLVRYDPAAGTPDAEDWARVAKSAGCRRLVLAADPVVDAKTLPAFAEACSHHGLECGFAVAPFAGSKPGFDTLAARLGPVLERYPVVELRIDAGTDSDEKATDAFAARLKRLRPDCAVTVDRTVGFPGGEGGAAPPDAQSEDAPVRFGCADFRSHDGLPARRGGPVRFTTPAGPRRLPFEQVLPLSRGASVAGLDEAPPRSAEELEVLLEDGLANGGSVLFQVSADRDGRLRSRDADRLFALADRLGIRGGGKLVPARMRDRLAGAKVTASRSAAGSTPAYAHDASVLTAWVSPVDSGSLTFSLKYLVAIDRIVLREHLVETDRAPRRGDYAVRAFAIEATTDKGDRLTLGAGRTIGAAKVFDLDRPVVIRNLTLAVSDASGSFAIADVRAGLSSDREATE